MADVCAVDMMGSSVRGYFFARELAPDGDPTFEEAAGDAVAGLVVVNQKAIIADPGREIAVDRAAFPIEEKVAAEAEEKVEALAAFEKIIKVFAPNFEANFVVTHPRDVAVWKFRNPNMAAVMRRNQYRGLKNPGAEVVWLSKEWFREGDLKPAVVALPHELLSKEVIRIALAMIPIDLAHPGQPARREAAQDALDNMVERGGAG